MTGSSGQCTLGDCVYGRVLFTSHPNHLCIFPLTPPESICGLYRQFLAHVDDSDTAEINDWLELYQLTPCDCRSMLAGMDEETGRLSGQKFRLVNDLVQKREVGKVKDRVQLFTLWEVEVDECRSSHTPARMHGIHLRLPTLSADQ
jgi:hypothetical protein